MYTDAEIGWRPTPEKNIEKMPCWGKNSPENCLVDLGRDTRTSTQSRRLVRRKGTHAHELGATAITDWLGIAFSTDWLSTDDLGQDVGERAQK